MQLFSNPLASPIMKTEPVMLLNTLSDLPILTNKDMLNFFDFPGEDINHNKIEKMGDIAGEKATLVVNVASY